MKDILYTEKENVRVETSNLLEFEKQTETVEEEKMEMHYRQNMIGLKV